MGECTAERFIRTECQKCERCGTLVDFSRGKCWHVYEISHTPNHEPQSIGSGMLIVCGTIWALHSPGYCALMRSYRLDPPRETYELDLSEKRPPA